MFDTSPRVIFFLSSSSHLFLSFLSLPLFLFFSLTCLCSQSQQNRIELFVLMVCFYFCGYFFRTRNFFFRFLSLFSFIFFFHQLFSIILTFCFQYYNRINICLSMFEQMNDECNQIFDTLEGGNKREYLHFSLFFLSHSSFFFQFFSLLLITQHQTEYNIFYHFLSQSN